MKGSGAGVPSLILALFRDDLSVHGVHEHGPRVTSNMPVGEEVDALGGEPNGGGVREDLSRDVNNGTVLLGLHLQHPGGNLHDPVESKVPGNLLICSRVQPDVVHGKLIDCRESCLPFLNSHGHAVHCHEAGSRFSDPGSLLDGRA